MNQTKQVIPIGKFETEAQRPEHGIGFALAVPAGMGVFFPPQNSIGVHLLSTVIDAALQARGIGFEGNVAGLELNQAQGFYYVTHRLAGLQVIQATLEKFFLLPFACIGWVDKAEGIWRCHYPQERPVDMGVFFTRERLETMERQVECQLAQARRWLAERGTNP